MSFSVIGKISKQYKNIKLGEEDKNFFEKIAVTSKTLYNIN